MATQIEGSSTLPEAAKQTFGVLDHLKERMGSDVDLSWSGYVELASGRVPASEEDFSISSVGSRNVRLASKQSPTTGAA